MGKLLGKLLVGVAGGVAVWFLTQSPYSPFTGPDVQLAAPTVPRAMAAGEEFRVSYAVTNQRNRSETGCGSYVFLEHVGGDSFNSDEPGEEPPVAPTITRPEVAIRAPELARIEISAPPEARQVSEMTVSDLRAITEAREVPRITKKPEIVERLERRERPERIQSRESGRALGECRTGRSGFDLDGAAGSSIQVLANCRADTPGTYRMTYGVSCQKFWKGQWHLEGEAHLNVDES